MAKKLSLDFSRNAPSWAADLRRQHEGRKNAESKVDAAIAEILSQDDSVTIREEERNKAVDDLLRTGNFDIKGESVADVFKPAPAPVMPARAPATSPESTLLPRSVNTAIGRVEDAYNKIPVVGQARQAFFSGLSDIVADVMFRDTDAAAVEQVRKAKEEERIKQSSLPEPLARVLYTDIVSPLVAEAGEAVGGNPEYRRAFGNLSKYVDTTRKSLDEQLAADVEEYPILGRLKRAGVDVAGSPQSLASIPGGVFATIPAGTTFNDVYRQAREAGLDPEEATEFATKQAAVEGGISAIPAGRVGRLLLGGGKRTVAKGLAEVLESRAGRVAKTAVGESVEEMTQTVASDVVDRLSSVYDEDEQTRKFAQGQISPDLLAETGRAGLAGFAGGVAAGSPHASIAHAVDAGRQAAETNNAALLEAGKVMRPSERKQAEADAVAEKQAAFEQAELEAADRKELEEEAAFRTLENRKLEEKLATVGTVTPSPEVTPEQVDAERTTELVNVIKEQQKAEQLETERKERVELGSLTEDIRKQREVVKKDEEKAAKAQAKKDKAAETKRRTELARQIAIENPDVAEADLAPMLRERLAQPVAAGTKTTPAKTKTVAPKTTDKKMGNAEVSDLSSRLGLGMQEAVADTKEAESFDRPSFEKKVGAVVRTLVNKNRQDTADVQNLIRQGKLVLVPNAESVGLDATDDVAQYVPEDGRMYLFTDKVDAKNAPAIMARALHESTHAGQFNDRQGRPSVLKQMMSKDKYNKVNGLIHRAANTGNKMAQTALRSAQDASPKESIQNLELVPYFVTEAAKARGTTLGSLRGVGNDILSAGRGFLRDKMGVDFDLSMSDIEAASHKVAGEVVKTNVKRQAGDALGMIGYVDAEGFDQAKKEGRVFRGRVDKGQRFEFSDKEAFVADSAIEKLADNPNKSFKLGDILTHKELYKQYPWLKDYSVEASPNLEGSWGEHSPKQHLIRLATPMVTGAQYGGRWYPRMRNTLLHEIQHAIQANAGYNAGANPGNFLPAEAQLKIQAARDKYNDIVDNFEIRRAVQTLSPDSKRIWESEIMAAGVTSRHAQSALFLENGYYDESSDRLIQRYGQTFAKTAAERAAAELTFSEAEKKAFKTYLREYSEAEARNTEARSQLSQERINELGNPESSFVHAEGKIPVEETLDTKPLAGKRESAASAKPLGMAEQVEETQVKKRRVPAAITGLLRSDIGLGKTINEIVEYARSSPAGARLQAEAHLERYGKALTTVAKQRGTTSEALAKEIEKKLDAVDKKSDDYETNRENFIQVASQYGDAGKNLIALRDMIDELSLGVLRQRAAEGTPLSEAEKKTYKTILSNLGRYSHRTYAATKNKLGGSYAKDLWKSFEKANKGKKLDEGDRQNAAKVARAIDYLVDNELNIPEDEELANISTGKARALYSTWIGPRNADAIPVEKVKDELAAIRDDINGNKKRLTNQAEATARELLGLTDSTGPLVQYYRGAKEDTGILKEREAIPKELRDLMGEITEPAAKLMITVGKQAEFAARNKMMLELRKNVGTDIQPPAASGTDAVKGMTQLEGDQYGPMEGYYVTPNMRAFIGDTMQQLATFEQAVAMANHKPQELPKRVLMAAFDKWASIASVSKAASVIGNPVRFIYNYIGSYRQLVSNGNLNPKYWVEGHKAMYDVLSNALNPSIVTERLKDANTYGVTDSAFIGEIKSEEYRKIAEIVKKMSGKSPSATLAFMKKLKVGYKETYAMMDVWSKLANFYHQVDVLTAFHKANGDKVSEEQIKREAADKVNRTNITYKRAAPLIKGMERGGVTQFGTYFAEVFRSEIGNALQGVEEYRQALNADTPKARNIMLMQATKRIGGQTATWSMAAYATRALAQMTFGDDEEKEDKLRALLPEYLRNQDFVSVGKDAEGRDVLFNMSQLDPIGPATDIMRDMLNGEASPEGLSKSIFDLYIAPRIAMQLITAAGTMLSDDVRPPKRKTTLQEVAPGVYSDVLNVSPLENRQTKAWLNVVESFAPGWIKAARSDNAHPEGVTDALTYMGATMYRLEPEKQAKFAAMDYSAALKNARRDVADFFGSHPTYTKEQLITMLVDQREAEKEAYDKTRKVYEGMIASGMPPRRAAAVLKAERLSADVIKSIRRGDFDSAVVSKKSITEFMKQEIANAKTLEEKKEVKRKWNEAWKLLRAADRDIDREEQ